MQSSATEPRLRIAYCYSSSWISRAIEWASLLGKTRADRSTLPKISHVALIAPGALVGDVIEAGPFGWTINTTQKMGATIVEILDTEVPLRLDLALQWLWTPYAYGAIVGMLVVCMARLLRRIVRNPWPQPHHMFCDEGAAYLMQASGEPGADALDPTSITPLDLYIWQKNKARSHA